MKDIDTDKVTLVRKEMGITHQEFYTGLPNLLAGAPCRRSGNSIHFLFEGRPVEITLAPQGVRELGRSVRMPVTPLTMRLYDFPRDAVERFVKLFNLRFMKGGG